MTAQDAHLPPRYAIAGTVVKGLDVVDLIGTLGIGGDLSSEVGHISSLPSRIVEIERVTVVVSS